VSSADETTKSIYDKDGYLLDKLPDTLNFGGKKVTMLYWKDVENPEFFVDDVNGSIVNDAIFDRNATVEKRLGISYDFVGTAGNWSNYENFVTVVRNSINGGDVYDVIGTYSLSGGALAYNGLVSDISALDYIDFSAPWWSEKLLETAKIKNKLFFVSGDISTNLLYMMYTMFYNKDLCSDMGLEDPFSFVESGEWTFDKMTSMSKGVYADLDGDQKLSLGDRYAQPVYVLHMDSLLYGMGIVTVDTDAEGEMKLSDDFLGEKMGNVTELVYKYIHSDDAPIYSDNGYQKIFKAGRALFNTDRADVAVFDISDREFTMGILPIPKYDENQEDYLTVIGNPFTLYLIPDNAPDKNMSAAILECQASESYRKVSPAIFEISMKTRYSDGGNDVVSYDILRAGIVYDPGRLFGRIFDSLGTSPGTSYQNQIKNGSPAWSTVIKTQSKIIGNALKKINDALED
ncbi:MAG: hypothetical protein MJ137_08080, partial [Clostridia bacterium]|nr:hypothetical protein [Clostridia bacterium]